MTDVLLAHSFFLANDAKQREQMRPYPPLGTLYAASYLRSRGHSVALFDATFATDVESFRAALQEHRPRFVALYEDTFHFLNKMCLGHAREAACKMSEMARAAGATVLAAGSDVTDHPEVFLAHGVDYALIGEADHTLIELIDALSAQPRGRVDTVHGLVFLAADGTAEHTPPRAAEKQPDIFPLPAWDLIDGEAYGQAWRQQHGEFGLNMITTRGCPFHCNWCAKPIWGQGYAMRSAAGVADEMALLKRTLKPDHLWFADDIFGLRPRWVTEFALAVEERGALIPFRIQSRVDLMTEKAVASLARAGCVEVWLGVESGSQKILDAMDKGTRLEQVGVARRRLADAGIRACFFLQFGYPGETWDDLTATIELVRQTLPDGIGISVSYPLPGTRFYNMVHHELGTQDHWQDSDDLAMMFQGTFTTAFYRRLHRLVHRDLKLRRSWALPGGDTHEAERDALAAEWREVERLAESSRSAAPTQIEKPYSPPLAPDLSRAWN
jgi:anaerobic magnesium-protoporphyrin IX monomethyl ester cyclase